MISCAGQVRWPAAVNPFPTAGASVAGHRLTVAGKRGTRHGAHFGHAAQIDSCSSESDTTTYNIYNQTSHRDVFVCYFITVALTLLSVKVHNYFAKYSLL